jgi:hypothetical protein
MNILTLLSIAVNVALIIIAVRSRIALSNERQLVQRQAIELEGDIASFILDYKGLVALKAIEQVMHLYNRVPASTFLDATRSMYRDIQEHGFLFDVDGDSAFFADHGI